MGGGLVTPDNPNARARDELSRVDYFLDHLARAVERGEVPLSSYETLAPRYLARRAELVAAVTQRPVVRESRQNRSAEARSEHAAASALDHAPAFATAAASDHAPAFATATAPAFAPAAAAKPRREREPVRWTTVLLYLGAFLVIVASAIFALAVWNITGPGVKLGFMGALTIGFYAAGAYARTKLGLKAGGTALTVVGSAMLLFDCWILIDGFNLQSMTSWALALLFCSIVYWFTEVRLGERFYGVAGAAAQVGWWWLLGAGMHLEYPVRIAGIAVVALLWQLTAERVREQSSFASLGRVLEWAAPLVQTVAAVALLVNLVAIGSPDARTLFAAAVASAAAATVVLRTRIPLPSRPVIAALVQLPLLVAALMSAENPGWLLVAVLASMSVAYALVSLFVAGAPFAIIALISEFMLVGVVCDLFRASDHVTAVAFGALAVTWALASRLASVAQNPVNGSPLTRTKGASAEFSGVAGVGSAVLLVLASGFAVDAGAGVALSGVRITATDAATSGGLLIAWAVSALIKRNPLVAVGTSLWSLYALASLLAWASPGLQSGLYALALVALCALWYSARGVVARFCRTDAELLAWLYRVLIVLVAFGGLVAQAAYFGREPVWAGAVLVLATEIFFATDAALEGPSASALAAGMAGTGAAFLLGHAYAVETTPNVGALAVLALEPASLAAVAAAGGAALIAAVGALLRRGQRAREVAAAAVVFGTILAAFSLGEPVRAAAALALLAVAWVATAIAARVQVFSAVAGVSAFASAIALVAAIDGSPWLTVAVAAAACVALNAPAFARVFGPGGSLATAGRSLAVAGIAGALGVGALGMPYALSPELLGGSGWLAFGEHGVAALLAVAGAVVLAQAVRWKTEAALYVGFGILLLALFAEVHALSINTAEFYSTPLAFYLVTMGYLYAWRVPGRGVPAALDAGAVLVGLGVPLAGALSGWGQEAFAHTAWAIALSLAFIAGGVAGRCRVYLFGGAGALALVAGWRTMTYLAEFWWLALGLIGMAMLVIALTWERQRMMLSETQRRLRDSFEHWR